MLTTRIYWILLAVAATVAAVRLATGRVDPSGVGQTHEYDFAMDLEIRDAVGDFELEAFLPARQGTGGRPTRIHDENLSAGELRLRVDERPGGRTLVVRGGHAQLPARVHYRARVLPRARRFTVPLDLGWDDLEPVVLDSTAAVPTGHDEVMAELARLFPEATGPADAGDAWAVRLRRAGVSPLEAARRIHRACLDGLRPASFSGNTDALTALRLGEASCGGKTRLMAALARSLGIGARLRGGVILGNTRPKRTSHVWVELRLGDHWVPYDPLNGYAEEIPGHYLPLYTGDLPLIRHSRGLSFDYAFRSPLRVVPRAWTLTPSRHAARLGAGPLRREQFSLILLAPFALLLTVFVRQVIGVESIGVFLPVLLGFCVTQVGWALSAWLLAGTLGLGVIVRLGLFRLNLLHVPRAATMITFIVLLFLMLSLVLDRFDLGAPRGVLALPMAALAMTVEKITTVALDRGTRDALTLLLQTLFLGAGCALILLQPLFQALTINFPEILLVVLAEILVIGQYRGLRLREVVRFRTVGARS